MRDVTIIGAGVFGCVVGKALQECGLSVRLFDRREAMSGSAASGFLIKESWTSMGKGEFSASMQLLDDLYGYKVLEFTVGGNPNKKTEGFHINANRVLRDPSLDIVEDDVEIMEGGRGQKWILRSDGTPEFSRSLIVCAGAWTPELTPVEGFSTRQGISFIFNHAEITEPIIDPWAPYKQVVAHAGPDEATVWGGDGSAIKPENWDKARSIACQERVIKAVGPKLKDHTALFTSRTGLRPYVAGAKPCYIGRPDPNMWVITGGAKNGTIAAAYSALTVQQHMGFDNNLPKTDEL